MPGTGHAGIVAAVSAVLLCLVLMCLPPGMQARFTGILRLVSDPAQSFAGLCARAARGAWGGLEDGANVSPEALRGELAEYQTAFADLRESVSLLENENRVLRNRIAMAASVKELSLAVCEVLQRDPFSKYYDYIVINRGITDGVKPGAPVLTEAGLVGMVTDAGMSSARVTLITSRDFAMPCRVKARNVNGLLTGAGTNAEGTAVSMLQPVPAVVVNSLDGILFDKVVPGDLVTVSANGEYTGPSITVGRVREVESTVAGAPILRLSTAVSFSQLRYVFAVAGVTATTPEGKSPK